MVAATSSAVLWGMAIAAVTLLFLALAQVVFEVRHRKVLRGRADPSRLKAEIAANAIMDVAGAAAAHSHVLRISKLTEEQRSGVLERARQFEAELDAATNRLKAAGAYIPVEALNDQTVGYLAQADDIARQFADTLAVLRSAMDAAASVSDPDTGPEPLRW